MNVSEFVLKATPPRMPGATLVRAHLLHERRHVCTALLVISPAGFGKHLVLTWSSRREDRRATRQERESHVCTPSCAARSDDGFGGGGG